MRLKSIELIGFKSFPDKTTLNFERGVTVIVGPNGSGKSNISDAIRWVLGELSSKSIRGAKMEDVIFGGSSNRKAMGYTQVSLVIDNRFHGNEDEEAENKRLPVDFDEVEVTRRYYRTGESEYMINRKTVRLKDIYELFMNTGIGKTGYSIIGQGKSAEIISQKSNERRIIFEEAAGISKYRYKKQEAEKKLASAHENLVRVNDILSELETRVVPLEKEAEKAKKYLEIYENKKKADISLWLYDVKNIHENLENTEKELAIAAKELEIAEDELQSLERSNDKFFLEQQQNKMLFSAAESSIKTLEEQKHSLESSSLLLENELKHIASKKDSLAELLSQNRDDLKKYSSDRQNASNLLESAKGEYTSLEKNFSETESLIEEKQLLWHMREEEEKAIVSRTNEIDGIVISHRIALSSLEGAKTGQKERITLLNQEAEEYEKNISLLLERINKASYTVEKYLEKIEDEKRALSSIEENLISIRQELKSRSAEKDKLFLDIESKKQKCSSLIRMEELFEGYSSSVRFVMKLAEEGRLDGIYGPLSHLITVEKKYGIAIETTLGSNIQNIICEDESSAKQAIRALKDSSAGRATFYPVMAMRYTPLNLDSDTRLMLGFIGIAHELIGYDAKYSPVIGFVLGRTLVFDNIDNASSAAKKCGYKYRIVTLDGQLINSGGSYTGGSVKRDSGILTRREEIARIEKDMQALKASFESMEREIKSLEKRLSSEENDKQNKEALVQLTSSLMTAEDTQKKILDSQIANDKLALGKIRGEIELISSKSSSESTERNRITLLISEGEKSLEEQKHILSEKTSQIQFIREEIEQIRLKSNSLRVSLAEKRKDIAANESALDSVHLAFEQTEAQIENQEKLIYELDLQEINNANELEKNRSALKNIFADIESSSSERERLRREIESKDFTMSSLRENIKGATNRKELLFRRYTQLNSRFEQLKNESGKLSERIWEEYELTYSEANALGYPKVDEENRKETSRILTESKNKLRAMGHVNINAIDEYREVKEKHDFLKNQSEDLISSRNSLINVIAKIEREMRVQFIDSFEKINKNFSEVFTELFGGGKAEVRLEDSEDVLESGIEIIAAPPGKIIKNLVQLSGGEQTFVCIALFFAILKVNPTPFCLLDEIESALDEVNVERFAEYIKNYKGSTQFILISHRRGTIERADTLYGVTMYEKGISKILTLDVSEVEQKTGVKI